MTPKQKAFADEYLICGNATEAAKKAGYSDKTAAVIGAQNLTKLNVLKYIAERQKKIDDSRIADATEVLKFYSAVMRNEEKDQFGLDAALSDRISAARELMKRYERTDDGRKDALAKLDEVLKEIGGVV